MPVLVRTAFFTILAGMLTIAFRSGFLIVVIMAFVLQRPETLFFGAIFCSIYAAFNAIPFQLKRNEFLVGSIVFLACLPGALTFNHGISPLFYLFSTFVVYVAAKNFNSTPIKVLSSCLQVVFWLAVFSIGYVLVKYWDFPEPLGEVIPGSSTNGIPSYLIVIQIALSLAIFLEKKKLPMVSPLFTLVVAIFGLGRGSMVIAMMILSASIAINFFMNGMARKTRLLVLGLTVLSLITVLFILGLYFNFDLFFNGLIEHSKFREGLVDPYREEIFSQYWDKLDYFSVFFGADYSGTVIATQYNGNPHISYLRLHAYYGMFGLLIVFFSPVLILLSNKDWRYKFVFLSFILFALIRALSEPLFFPTLLDFFYFSYFLMFFRYAPSVA